MGLGKLGMSLVQKTSAWVKACGKTSILQTKPVQKVNINELKYINVSHIKYEQLIKIPKINNLKTN